jgi:hypothetical protein
MTEQFKGAADTSAEDTEFTFNPARESERDNSTDSPAETDHDGEDPSLDGDKGKNNQDDPDKDKPFHEHPRWLEREKEWTERFNEQETRHGEELKKALDSIRDEFSEKRKDNAEEVKIPSWFGGTQEQWNEYRADRDAELQKIQATAEQNALAKIKDSASSEDKAVKEATEYMNSELKTISTDKAINPDGLKVDPNALVKFVIENELVDTKGRWNYKAGFKMMKASGLIKAKTTVTEDRKVIADATTDKSSKGEPSQKTFKTSLDFKKPGEKPW